MKISKSLCFSAAILPVCITLLMIPAASQAQETQPAPPAVEQQRPSVPESPKPNHRKIRLAIKPSAGIYSPSSYAVKKRFGSSWPMISLGVTVWDDNRDQSRLQLYADSISRTSGNDSVFLFPFGAKYTRRVNDSKVLSPYVGVTLGLCLAKVKVPEQQISTGFRCVGISESIFAGANIGLNSKVEVSYHILPGIRGYDFSGLNAGITMQF